MSVFTESLSVGAVTQIPMPATQTAAWVSSARHWSYIKSPQRPTPEDGSFLMRALAPVFQDQTTPCRIVVLGVTPEVVGLNWPDQVSILAFDQSEDMIRMVWSPNPHCTSSVTKAHWESMPLKDVSTQAIVGDASLNALPRLDAYPDVLREMYRVLEPGGLVALRCFVRPDNVEPLDTIREDVFSRKVGCMSALKWRLAMALAEPDTASVTLSSVYSAFAKLFPSREAFATATGWASEEIGTMDPYCDSPTCLNFPTLAQFHAAFAPWFDVTDMFYSSYELGEQCPTLVIQRRNAV